MRTMQNTTGELFPKFSLKEEHLARLILEIAAGNERALSAFYDATSPLVYGLALRILNNASEAEEISTDVYMQIWAKALQYDSARSGPLAWLMMLTRSRAIDRIRSGAQRRRFEESLDADAPDSSESPEDFAFLSEQSVIVRTALAKLDPRHQKTLYLAYFQGLSQSEIALKLGQPIGTIKSWMRFGIITLRNTLKDKD